MVIYRFHFPFRTGMGTTTLFFCGPYGSGCVVGKRFSISGPVFDCQSVRYAPIRRVLDWAALCGVGPYLYISDGGGTTIAVGNPLSMDGHPNGNTLRVAFSGTMVLERHIVCLQTAKRTTPVQVPSKIKNPISNIQCSRAKPPSGPCRRAVVYRKAAPSGLWLTSDLGASAKNIPHLSVED